MIYSNDSKPTTTYVNDSKNSTSFIPDFAEGSIWYLLTPDYNYILCGASSNETLILQLGTSYINDAKPS